MTVPDLSDGPAGPVVVRLPQTRVNSGTGASTSRTCCAPIPASPRCTLQVMMRDKTLVMRIGDTHRVTPSPALFADLKQLLGPGCLAG